MASKSNLVNLDAMIKRADFASEDNDATTFETFNSIPARELASGNPIVSLLRKPDFQRETNHWAPEQVVSLLECYINGDLIPSVILWKSPTYLFVIDGGHRLSVIRAWIEDDYGDGPISHKLFGHDISTEQRKAAEKTRKLINEKVGSWSYYKTLLDDDENITPEQKRRLSTITTRGLSVQWVKGDADKAETSFFNINMKGTPLDDIEELLLKNRKRPIPIAARAIIRAGKGHRYWSRFQLEKTDLIENEASKIHKLLFSPEIEKPIRTLDLPLGGSKGVRNAVQVLIDLMLIANRQQQKPLPVIESFAEDVDGVLTVSVLKNAKRLISRITGNGDGSLGLHPAIYFYGPSGRHSSPMFLGTVSLIGQKIANNDSDFFKKFTLVRHSLEVILIENKELVATIIQKHLSRNRVAKYHDFLQVLVDSLSKGMNVESNDLVKFSQLEGKVIAGDFRSNTSRISDETKSKIFINVALNSALKCPICQGYLDVEKSVSYDHIERVRDGGLGGVDNCQLTHPYCNQSVKN
ncbi:MAG: DUF262 domain-containing protein [Cellvibrio sp.]|uniref:GmrSD restriction endonuclease domain-containing protein n=1 Tax=Cellvibrio sp. TaxID=1965322 RepID=UPI0031A7133B